MRGSLHLILSSSSVSRPKAVETEFPSGRIPSSSGGIARTALSNEGDDCGKLIGSSGSVQRGDVLAEHPCKFLQIQGMRVLGKAGADRDDMRAMIDLALKPLE